MEHTEILDGRLVLIRRVRLLPTPYPSTRTSKTSAPFLKGPIPLWWLQRAAQLPGKALHVGIILWYRTGVTRAASVVLTRARLREFGIHHDTGRRALYALQQAGLVCVEQCSKRSPSVTLVVTPAAPPATPVSLQSVDTGKVVPIANSRTRVRHALSEDTPNA